MSKKTSISTPAISAQNLTTASHIKLCSADEIEADSAKSFDIGDQALFVVKRFDQVYAYRNRCPHLGLRLEWRQDRFFDISGELIQCATHGALFLPENGECIAGPCRGKALEALPVEIVNGVIYVSLC